MLVGGAVAGAALTGTGPAPTAFAAETIGVAGEPATTAGPATFRRLSEGQYKRSIEDIFGAGIKVPGRFEPPLRDEGLLAIGNGKVTVTPSGIEQYELRAREISAQVMAENRRKDFLSCGPAAPNTFDRACATAFLTKYGRLLFRRPLMAQETTSAVALANAATLKTQNFYKGLEFGLARLLASPNFIFLVEKGVADPQRPGAQRLDDYALASRISFFLWDAPPDGALLDAAADGSLRTQEGLERQVDRLIASPRFAQGVRAFFADMFGYEQFDGLSKDQTIFPKFTSQMAKDAQEQALRTIVELLITNKGDYRDLFTTKKTFINRNLGALYKVPIENSGIEGTAALDTWVPYSFEADDPRAGILTLAGFLMLDPTHEGRSSPTIRGKSVRELFLCQPVPMPPPNVDFSAVQNTADQVHKTARDRLSVHQQNPVCAGCHAITDPIGLSMENYDAIGNFRTQENGAPIDASGTFEGRPYKDLISLEQILHDSPTAPSCVVQRAYQYGVGRPLTPSEEKWVDYAAQRFAEDRYQFPALIRRIATSKAFQAVAPASIASAR
jgi:hypothetical protein